MTDDGRDNESQENPIDLIAEDFVARYRLGERPALTEYCLLHPELADDIRSLFPTLVMIEQARSQTGNPLIDSDSRTTNSIPAKLGEFKILREIGRGGMGIVYEAIQESLGRQVALKILPSYLLKNPKHSQRFQREARSAGRLHHPNIVPVFGVGEVNGVHYYAMQFIQGLGLDQVASEVKRLRAEKSGRNLKRDSLESSKESPLALDGRSASHLAEILVSGEFQLGEAGPSVSSMSFSDGQTCSSLDLQDPKKKSPASVMKSSSLCEALQSSAASHSSQVSKDTKISESIHEGGQAYWRSVARIGIQVAEALQYAADQGVLHRDIKPANLLLDLKGNVWVTDFGLAKADDSDELTNPGDIVGTLRYLAPERLHGKSELASDVYGLGATLYELLVLQPLFEGVKREQLLSVIAEVDPVRPRLIDGSIPADLETIVLKAISKDPIDRYTSASDFAEDLQRFLDDRPVRARRVLAAERVWRWCRRNPIMASLASASLALTLLLTIGLIVVLSVQRERDLAVANQDRAERAERETKQLLERVELAEKESRIRSHLAKANVLRQSGYEGQRFQSHREIELAAKMNPTGPLRDELQETAIAAMRLTDLKPLRSFSLDRPVRFCFDHALHTFVSTAPVGDRSLVWRSMEDGSEIFRHPPPEFNFFHVDLSFTPDDRFLLINYFLRDSTQQLQVWDVRARALAFSSPIQSLGRHQATATHSNHRYLVFPENSRELVVWDLQERRLERRIGLPCSADSICFSAAGHSLAVTDTASTETFIVDFESGEVTSRLKPPEELAVKCGLVSWSSDDQLLATSREDGTILVWNMRLRRITSVLQGHTEEITQLRFANRSNLLMSFSWDNTSRLWDAATGDCLVITDRLLDTFCNDDEQIGYMSNTEYGICTVSHDREVHRLHHPASGNRSQTNDTTKLLTARFGFDEKLLFTCGSKGADLWSVDDRRWLGSLPIGACRSLLIRSDESQFITFSDMGILRWPIETPSERSELIRVGPPIKLGSQLGLNAQIACWMSNEKQFAVAEAFSKKIRIYDAQVSSTSEPQRVLESDHGRFTNLATSSDGKWLAAGGHYEPYIQVWDLATGNRVRIRPKLNNLDCITTVTFSEDSRWLVCTTSQSGASEEMVFFETGSWKRVRTQKIDEIPSPPVFSEDGRLFATVVTPHEVLIAETESGRQAIRIRMKERRNFPVAFLSDRSVLAVAGTSDVYLWDLALIDETLKELSLAWDTTMHVERKSEHKSSPISIALDIGDLGQELDGLANRKRSLEHRQIATRFSLAQKFEDADREYHRALDLDPDNAELLNEVAWMKVTRLDRTPQHAEAALAMAEKGTRLQPSNSALWNTLGVAQYRTANFQKAITSLEKSEALEPRMWFATNAYFLAMSHWKLGQREDAKRWFDAAVEAHKASSTSDAELDGFRREADSTLAGE